MGLYRNASLFVCLPPHFFGIYFRTSADAGWDDLKGYDMSTGESNVLSKFVGGANEIFVVQVRAGGVT